jgi:glycine cleavage system H protein
VALDRAYDPAGHFWVSVLSGDRVRIGLDALGVETSGTIAQLAFLPLGEHLKRGEPFGSLEAAKFVGPLSSPLSGTVVATNDTVVADPALVERDPYGAGWLIELDLADPGELGDLISGADVVPVWFEGEVEDYRLKGVLAE